MSDRKSPAEPSMEEILASIRRILAEDEGGPTPPPRLRAAADVLDLTEAIGEDGAVRHIEPLATRRAATAPPVLPDGRVEPVPPSPQAEGGTLISEPASNAVSAAFSRLAATPSQPTGNGELAIEVAVRETLRPMLQAWLDEHLPALVERLVQAEIARLAGDAGKH